MEQTDDLQWLGRRQTVDDHLDPALVRRMAALFDRDMATTSECLPPLWHWAFFQAPNGQSELGLDGHPENDGFLPRRNGRQRMWAGGEVMFRRPLRPGRPARRISTLENVERKQGRTGALTFLLVRHEYFQDHDGPTGATVPAIIERQDIVYRDPAPPKTGPGEPPPTAQWQREVTPTTTLLFRYSAATFNGHRIHYDHPYATEQEGYPGLVVHGPLITTLMVDAFVAAQPQARLRRLRYRGRMPLISPTPFQVAGCIEETGRAALWAANDNGIAHRATLEFDT